MSVPQSLSKPFFDLHQSKSEDVLGGYCHKKFETLKMKGDTLNGGNWNYKAVYTLDDALNVKYSDDFKYGFGFKNYYFQSRIDRKGEIRYHLDFGKVNLLNYDFQPSFTLKTDSSFSKKWYRFANHYKGQNLELNTRVERDFSSSNMLSVFAKLKQGKVNLSSGWIVGLDQWNLQKYDVTLTADLQDDLEWFVKHQSSKAASDSSSSGLAFGKISTGFGYKLDNKTNLALQFYKNSNNDKIRVLAGLEHKNSDNVTFKSKCDQKGKVTLLSKHKLNKQFSLTLSSQLNFQNGSKFINFDSYLPLPFGYTLDVNV